MNETSSGALVFNDCVVHATNKNLPFGGVGNSGLGAYHGKFGFDAFRYAARGIAWASIVLSHCRAK